MALKMRLRPSERLAINGAVVRNSGHRAIEIEILNEATLLHERDIMLPEQADDSFKGLYLLIQSMHIEPELREEHRKNFIQMASQVYAQAYSANDTETCSLVNELILTIGEHKFVPALKRLQKLFGRPGDVRKSDEVA